MTGSPKALPKKIQGTRFSQVGCPSCPQTNNVGALSEDQNKTTPNIRFVFIFRVSALVLKPRLLIHASIGGFYVRIG